MVDTGTGEFTERTLLHEGNAVQSLYAALESPVVVDVQATGAIGQARQFAAALSMDRGSHVYSAEGPRTVSQMTVRCLAYSVRALSFR